MKKFFSLLFLALLLTGCATTEVQNAQALANAPLVEAGLINETMAQKMAEDDALKIQQLIAASPAQATENWTDPLSKISYGFTSLNIAVDAEGQACRSYGLTAVGGRHLQKWQAIACRQADGSWRAQKIPSATTE